MHSLRLQLHTGSATTAAAADEHAIAYNSKTNTWNQYGHSAEEEIIWTMHNYIPTMCSAQNNNVRLIFFAAISIFLRKYALLSDFVTIIFGWFMEREMRESVLRTYQFFFLFHLLLSEQFFIHSFSSWFLKMRSETHLTELYRSHLPHISQKYRCFGDFNSKFIG